MYEVIRELAWKLNLELSKNNLVAWTAGNVSVREPETDHVAIKPSGIRYDNLRPEQIVIMNLDGNILDGYLKPSSDTASHLYIYRNRSDINGIVHTHSNYATAFAALGQAIPVYLTAQADEFGGPIPCAPFARIGGEEIGQAVVEYIGTSPSILLGNHGVFAIGSTGEAAVKAAVMVEDIARTSWLALQLGHPNLIPSDEIIALHNRYIHKYGQ